MLVRIDVVALLFNESENFVETKVTYKLILNFIYIIYAYKYKASA